jgi:hypothetical protein
VKTVHKFSNRKKEDPSVEIETFYDYFKKLNAGDEDVNDHDKKSSKSFKNIEKRKGCKFSRCTTGKKF